MNIVSEVLSVFIDREWVRASTGKAREARDSPETDSQPGPASQYKQEAR